MAPDTLSNTFQSKNAQRGQWLLRPHENELQRSICFQSLLPLSMVWLALSTMITDRHLYGKVTPVCWCCPYCWWGDVPFPTNHRCHRDKHIFALMRTIAKSWANRVVMLADTHPSQAALHQSASNAQIIVPKLLNTVEGQPPYKGRSSGPLSHSSSAFLTSEKRTTSQQRTKWLIPRCPLFGGSTVAAYYNPISRFFLFITFVFVLLFRDKITIQSQKITSSGMSTVKPPIKDTPREEKPPNKGQNQKYPSIYTPYKITSERGQPLHKGQNAGSQVCPLFGGFTV